MNWYKKIRRICFYGSIGALASTIFLAIGYHIPRKWFASEKTECNWQICIENNGAHTNIIVPINNDIFAWDSRIEIDRIDNFPVDRYNYLSFGWGDRDFYLNTPTWNDLDLGLTFKALFLPTTTIMEVKGLNSLPNSENMKCIAVDRDEYLTLMEYIDRSFETDDRGKKIRIANGHFNRGGFYAATGTYSVLNSCNDWTANGLREADLNTPLWAGLSSSVMRHLKSNCRTDITE
jgi:uncharacterized protein (TIGR02117 family)